MSRWVCQREADVYIRIQICVMLSSCSVISDFATIPWTVAHQAPLSMGFSRQEYWNGLPFPSPGHLPDPGIEARSPASLADSLPLSHPGKPNKYIETLKHIHIRTLIYIGALDAYEYYIHMCLSLYMDSNINSCPFLSFRFSASQTLMVSQS